MRLDKLAVAAEAKEKPMNEEAHQLYDRILELRRAKAKVSAEIAERTRDLTSELLKLDAEIGELENKLRDVVQYE
jgi:C4-dicarboxylate-specific signal transduction histidine kinase